MITKITDNNIGKYISFLADAYQYLQKLERHKAYQFLSRKEWEKAYEYLLNKNCITNVFITDSADYTEIKDSQSFTSHEQFKKYCEKYKDNFPDDYENFVTSVMIIQNADRKDDEIGDERAFEDDEEFSRKIYTDLYKNSDVNEVYLIREEDRTQDCAFETLEQYFNYIELIRDSNRKNHFLLSLPLDEGILNIDANTRAITVPNDFISTVVQRDTLAETVIFTIDRFIDNIDLANVDKIYVQWSAPDGLGGVSDKATEIELKEVIDGKIKFGWPINADVTQHAGNISFSVTFFSFKPNSTELNFRLNTLPQTLEIKPALQPEINEETTIVKPASDYFYAVRNNKYPGVGVKAPLDPTFAFPGKDLKNDDPIELPPQEGETFEEKSARMLKFEAQAVTSDNGRISYSWWVCPEGCEKVYNCDPVITETVKENYYTCKPGDVINEKDYERLETNSQSLFEEVQVYNYTGSEKVFVYEIDGNDYVIFPEMKINKTSYDKLTEDSKKLFELNEKLKFYNFKGNQVEKVYYNPFGSTYVAFRKVSEEDLEAQDIYFVNFSADSERSKRMYEYLKNEKGLISSAFIDEADLEQIQAEESFTSKQFDKYYNRYLNQYPADKEAFLTAVDEPLKVIYVKNGDANNFIRYAGTSEQKTKQKYEKFTILEVPEEGPIVGKYFVRAVSSKPGRHTETKKTIAQLSNAIDSTVCQVKGPVDLEFKKNLDETIFIRDKKTFIGNTVLSESEYNNWYAMLEYDEDRQAFVDGFSKATDSKDPNVIKYSNTAGAVQDLKLKKIDFTTSLEGIDNPENYGELNYLWFKAEVDTDIKEDKFWEEYENKELSLLEDETSNTITFTEPGWYRLHIDATKNRKTNTKDSQLSRVTYYPREYSLALDQTLATTNNFYSDYVDGEYVFNGDETDVVEIGVTPYLWIDDKGNAITNEDLLYNEKVKNLYSYLSNEEKNAAKKNLITAESSFLDSDEAATIVLNQTFTSAQFTKYYRRYLEQYGADETNFITEISKIDEKYVDQKNNKIYTDGIEYKWYRRTSDKADVLLTANDPDLFNPVAGFGVDGYYPSKIKVKILPSETTPGETKVERYVCVATNFINKEKSEPSEAAVFRVG